MHRVFLWIVFVYACVFASPGLSFGEDGQAVALEGRLNTLLPANAHWALEVVDLASGSNIISIGNAKDRPLTPGSLVKLITTGAVLDYAARQGGFDMTTTILHDNSISDGSVAGNLYLIGRGNALLSIGDIQSAVAQLSRKGIKRIDGDIVADDTYFDATGLESIRKGAGYAPPCALGMDLHTAAVYVLPTKAGNPPELRIEPQNAEVKFSVSARTVSRMHVSIEITQIDDTSYSITGNIPEGGGVFKKRFSLKDPALYAAGTFKTLLTKVGILVSGRILKGKTPSHAKVLAEIKSQEISELLRDMNVNSLNVVADNMLLLLGKEKFGAPGTREKGLRAVREFLSTLGFSRDADVTIADGSGLSQADKVTSRFMARYLQKISKYPWFAQFEGSLPVAGVDGTLKDIGFTDRRFRAKTGKLENAFGLAGYGVDNKTGRNIAFSYIVNVPGADVMGIDKTGAEVMRCFATEGVQ